MARDRSWIPAVLWQPVCLPRLDRARGLGLLTLLALLPAVFPGPILRGEVLYYRDITAVWRAQVEGFVRAVSGGGLPTWDPNLGFGHPMLANPNTQVAYPVTWLNLVLPPGPFYVGYALAHLVFAGIGLALLGRRLGLSRPAAVLAGATFMASGPLLSLVDVWHHLAGAAWLPCVVLLADRMLATRRSRDAVLCGIAIALQVLAGSPDLCVFTGLVLLGQFAAGVDWRRPVSSANRRGLGLAALAVLVGLALAAIQWLPALAVAQQAGRASLPRPARVAWSLHPATLFQLIVPLSFESLSRLARVPAAAAFELWSPFLRSVYLGVASLPLAVAGLMARGRGRAALGATLLGAVLFALGRHTPAYDLICGLAPLLERLRYPSKALVLAAASWALLAGRGFDAWGRSGRRGSAAPSLLGVLLLFVAIVAGWRGQLAWAVTPDGPSWSALLAANLDRLTGTLASIAGVLVVLALACLRPRAWHAWALAGLLIADLGATQRRINPSADGRLFGRPEILDRLAPPSSSRIYVWDYMWHVAGGVPTLGMTELLFDVPGPNPLLAQAVAMQQYLYPPSGGRWGLRGSFDRDLLGLDPPEYAEINLLLRGSSGSARYLRLLQLGGVDFVIALQSEGQSGLEHRATLAGLYRRPIEVFSVPGRLPRAYLVSRVREGHGSAGLLELVDPGFDPRREAVLPGPIPVPAPGGNSAEAPGEAAIVFESSDRVRVEAKASHAALLVLLDAYEDGWRARVDGAAVPVLRANHVFRGVPLPAGRHVVEFVYRPRSLTWGAAISLLGALSVAVVLGWPRSGSVAARVVDPQ